jgi:hypothetical protein
VFRVTGQKSLVKEAPLTVDTFGFVADIEIIALKEIDSVSI